MIRDAPVLILDEPTTGLDAQASARLSTPLRRLMAGRTTIVISHQLTTVTDVDQIIYLDHGRITEVGTHHQLLASNGGYARLYRLCHPTGPGRHRLAAEVSTPAVSARPNGVAAVARLWLLGEVVE